MARTTRQSTLAHELLLLAGKLTRGEVDPLAAVPLMTKAAHHIIRLETSCKSIAEQIELLHHNADVAGEGFSVTLPGLPRPKVR